MEGDCSTCRNSLTLLVYWRRLSTTPTIVAQSTAKMKALVCLVDSASTETVYLLAGTGISMIVTRAPSSSSPSFGQYAGQPSDLAI